MKTPQQIKNEVEKEISRSDLVFANANMRLIRCDNRYFKKEVRK